MAAPSAGVSVSTTSTSARNRHIGALPFSILVLSPASINLILRDPARCTRGTPWQQQQRWRRRRQTPARRSPHDPALGLA